MFFLRRSVIRVVCACACFNIPGFLLQLVSVFSCRCCCYCRFARVMTIFFLINNCDDSNNGSAHIKSVHMWASVHSTHSKLSFGKCTTKKFLIILFLFLAASAENLRRKSDERERNKELRCVK